MEPCCCPCQGSRPQSKHQHPAPGEFFGDCLWRNPQPQGHPATATSERGSSAGEPTDVSSRRPRDQRIVWAGRKPHDHLAQPKPQQVGEHEAAQPSCSSPGLPQLSPSTWAQHRPQTLTEATPREGPRRGEQAGGCPHTTPTPGGPLRQRLRGPGGAVRQQRAVPELPQHRDRP